MPGCKLKMHMPSCQAKGKGIIPRVCAGIYNTLPHSVITVTKRKRLLSSFSNEMPEGPRGQFTGLGKGRV